MDRLSLITGCAGDVRDEQKDPALPSPSGEGNLLFPLLVGEGQGEVISLFFLDGIE
jgi:hypothetical protein